MSHRSMTIGQNHSLKNIKTPNSKFKPKTTNVHYTDCRVHCTNLR